MSGFFLGPGDMPEELKQQLEHEHVAMHLRAELVQHELETFLMELSVEQTRVLKMWFMSMAHSPDPRLIIMMTLGDLQRLYSIKTNTCIVCEKNHDDISELTPDVPSEPQVPQTDEEVIQSFTESLGIEPETPDVVQLTETFKRDTDSPNVFKPVGEIEPVELTVAQKMERWHLIRDPESPGNFLCARCGYQAGTLQDRMMKEPEDCPGCHHKAAWG